MLFSLVGRCHFEGEILQNTCSESVWGSSGSEMLASGKQLPESFSSPYCAPTCIMLWGCIYSQELSEWPYVRISMHIHLVNVACLLLQAINRTINRKVCLHACVTTSEHTHMSVFTWVLPGVAHCKTSPGPHSLMVLAMLLCLGKSWHPSFYCADKFFNLYPWIPIVRLSNGLNSQTYNLNS